jgi:16S rRNA (adenine(1408)-N(1))-methyltransferase
LTRLPLRQRWLCARASAPFCLRLFANEMTERRKKMESIWGRHSLFLDATTLAERLRGYEQILIDVGTGDGRFVQQMAATRADCFVLGIDACRENLRLVSRKTPGNALYVIANACALPCELHGLATHITINFPWGSLLAGLLTGDEGLMNSLAAVARPGARINVRLNGSALIAAGRSLEAGVIEIRQWLLDAGFDVKAPSAMSTDDLRRLPTTWAKRLAFGRDRAAMTLNGIRRKQPGSDLAFSIHHSLKPTLQAVGCTKQTDG